MGESTPNSVKKSRETRVFKRITLYPPLWLTIFGHKEPLLRLKTFDQDKKNQKRQKRRQNRQKHIVWKESMMLYIRAVSHSCDVSIKGHIFHPRYLRFNHEGNNWNVSSLKCFWGGFVQNVPNIISFFQIKQTLSCLRHFPHILKFKWFSDSVCILKIWKLTISTKCVLSILTPSLTKFSCKCTRVITYRE